MGKGDDTDRQTNIQTRQVQTSRQTQTETEIEKQTRRDGSRNGTRLAGFDETNTREKVSRPGKSVSHGKLLKTETEKVL